MLTQRVTNGVTDCGRENLGLAREIPVHSDHMKMYDFENSSTAKLGKVEINWYAGWYCGLVVKPLTVCPSM